MTTKTLTAADKAELATILAAMRQIEQATRDYADRLYEIENRLAGRKTADVIECAAHEISEVENRSGEAITCLEIVLKAVMPADDLKAAEQAVTVTTTAGSNVVAVTFGQ